MTRVYLWKTSTCMLPRKRVQDYLEGMADSIDVVPIGAYYGKDRDASSSQWDLCNTTPISTFLKQGKRSGAYGAYLLAIYDQEVCTMSWLNNLNALCSHLCRTKNSKLCAKRALASRTRTCMCLWLA